MEEFVLLFRQPGYDYSELSAEEVQTMQEKWQNWAAGIAEQAKLVSRGPRLKPEGKTLKKSGVITDGPFVEIREILGGFMIIKAESLDEAITLAHGCPALEADGCVEIRPYY